MTFRTKVAAVLAVMVGMVTSTLVASPAMADLTTDCRNYAGTVCMADGVEFTGQVWRQTPGQIVGCRRLSPEGFNNEASIAFNNTFGDGVLFIYDSDNCTGRNIGLGSQVGTRFTNTHAWLNNKASSIKFIQV